MIFAVEILFLVFGVCFLVKGLIIASLCLSVILASIGVFCIVCDITEYDDIFVVLLFRIGLVILDIVILITRF